MSNIRHRSARRSGAVLVMVALLLPVLVGMVGMLVDGGLIMTAHRGARNAADAAALAAALDLREGSATNAAQATAISYVRQYNGLAEAHVTVNIPPATGAYAGNTDFAEVVVRRPVTTHFLGIFGASPVQNVSGRAVAGYHPVNVPERILTLNPDAHPGLKVSGNGTILVDGGVAVNSEGGGVTESGDAIDNGNGQTAAFVTNNAVLRAPSIRVVGGVNRPENFEYYDDSMTGSPLQTGVPPRPDPFLYLAPPTVANGADPTEWPAVHVTGNRTVTLNPGVYPSIRISSGTVTFNPGIYIIRGGELRVTSQGATGEGVMFYITGSDYNVNTGLPDSADLDRRPAASGGTNFGGVTFNAGLRMTGIDDPNSPFQGLLFYQRRWNTEQFRIQGNSASGRLMGTLYAKWADVTLAGNGTYNAQFVVGSMTSTGNGNITIEQGGSTPARSDQIFLVE
jgi:hypothetical protein